MTWRLGNANYPIRGFNFDDAFGKRVKRTVRPQIGRFQWDENRCCAYGGDFHLSALRVAKGMAADLTDLSLPVRAVCDQCSALPATIADQAIGQTGSTAPAN